MFTSATPHRTRSFTRLGFRATGRHTAKVAGRGPLEPRGDMWLAVHGAHCICHTCARRAEAGRLAA